MTMRHRKKQFWWTWHGTEHHHLFDWGIGRIKHQHTDCIKDRRLG